MPAATLTKHQEIEAAVSGPDGANRLFTCTGQAEIKLYLDPEKSTVEVWTFFVGPRLSRREFHRAAATSFVTADGRKVTDPAVTSWHNVAIDSVEADWDDETGRTEMRVEIRAEAGPGVFLSVTRLGFSAYVLGELPSA